MSKTIDERVVEMRFDNKQFEQGVQTTMSTLEKLKEKLNFKSASKGFDNINNSVKNVNMSSLSNAVETVHAKFSALDVFAITSLQRIADSAITAGKNLVSAFTIDPVKSGFEEYETQINSVQTILANTKSKGNTLDDVNQALDELNKYADMTIYNFTEMTRNIGTFTAAGVDLETSVKSIKGIANLAAVSGSTSQQASTAMYQLSQALASGTVKLQDWNSVVNAGMGGQVFQDALLETARVHGIKVDDMIKKEGSFRESLTKGAWLTTEILTETLDKFTGDMSEKELKAKGYTDEQIKGILDLGQTANEAATKVKTFTQLMDTLKEAAQSGWTKTWETIIGDFDEAKTLFTEISDGLSSVIGRSSDARNELISGAFDSKWSQLTEKINECGIATDDFQNALIKTAKTHGINVKAMMKDGKTFEETLKNGWLSPDIIKETFKNFIDGEKSVGDTSKAVTKDLKEMQSVVNKVIKGDFGNGEKRVKELTKAGYEYKTVQSLVNKQLKGGKITIDDLSDSQLKQTGYTDEQIKALRELAKEAEKTGTPINELIEQTTKPSGRELFIDSFRNVFKGLYTSITAVTGAYRDMFPKMTSQQLYNIIESFHKLTVPMNITDETANDIRRTFRGLFAIVKIFTTFTGGAMKVALTFLSKLLSAMDMNILDLTGDIGDMLVSFSKFVTENNFLISGLEFLADILAKCILASKDWVKSVANMPIVSKTFTSIINFAKLLYKSVSTYIGNGGKVISDFIDKIQNVDEWNWDTIVKMFKTFKTDVIDYFLNVDGYFKDVTNVINKFRDVASTKLKQVSQKFNGLGNVVDKVMTLIKDKISGIDFGAILLAGLGAGVLVMVKKMGKLSELFLKPMDAITDLFDTVGSSIERYGNSAAFKNYSQGLFTIAGGIAVLAGALLLISKIPSDKLMSSTLAMIALAGALTAMAAGLALVNKLGGETSGMVSLAAIAISMAILINELRSMEDMDTGAAIKNLGIIGILMAELVASCIVISKFAPKLSKGSIMIIMVAGALKILVSSFNDLKDVKMETALSSITMIGAMFTALMGIMKLSGGIKITDGFGLLGIVVALKLFVSVISDIADINLTKIENNLMAFVAIFGSIALVMASTSLAGKYAIKGGVAIMAVSASLLLMCRAFDNLAALDKTKMDNASSAITSMLVVFGGIVALTKFSGKYAARSGILLLSMGGVLAVVSGLMVVLSKLDPSGLKTATMALSSLTLCFGVIVGLTKLMDNVSKNGVKMMTKIMLTISLLAISLGVLSNVNPDNLSNASNAISQLMLMFGMLMAVSSLAKKCSSTVTMMTGVMGAMAGILYILDSLQIDNTLQNAKALSTMILSLSAACTLISLVPISSAVSGMAGFSAFIAIMAGVLAALGGLTKINGFNELISDGGGVLGSIGYAIGNFVGSIAGGIGAGITSGLPEMGDNLSKFMNNIQPFIDGVGNIDSSVATSIAALGGALLAITGASIIDGLSSLFGIGDMSEFGEKIKGFATAIVDFSDVITGSSLDAKAVETAANAGKLITELANSIPKTGGLLQALTGEIDMTTFSSQLAGLAKGIVDFSNIISQGNVSEEAVKAGQNAGLLITELASSIPKSGGLWQSLTGEIDMATFGSQLSSLAKGIVDFSNIISQGNVSEEAVEAGQRAGMLLTTLADSIPNSGGALAAFLGDNDIAVFGQKLPELARGIVGFAREMKSEDFDETVFNSSVVAGNAIVDLANKIPTSGGILAGFLGDNDIQDFGVKLVLFGKAFAEYASTMTNVDAGIVTATSSAAQSIVELANNLPESGGWFSNDTNLADFGEDMAEFGKSYGDFAYMMSLVSPDDVNKALTNTFTLINMMTSLEGLSFEGVPAFAKALAELGQNGITEFVNTFSNAETSISVSATSIIDVFLNAVNGKKGDIDNCFIEIADSIVKTIRGKNEEYKSSGTNIGVKVSEGVKSAYSSMTNAGKYLVQGFASGISSTTSQAVAKARGMASQAANAVKKELDIHSPSRVMAKLGSFAGMGFINGLDTYVDRSYDTSSKISKSAIDGLNTSMKGLNDLFNGNVETHPTITPVLDLSDVESGAGQINTLFSRSQALSVKTGVGGRISRGISNDDIVNAINNLGQKLNNIGNTTYQVNGVTYDNGSNVSSAVESLVHAAIVGGRI